MIVFWWTFLLQNICQICFCLKDFIKIVRLVLAAVSINGFEFGNVLPLPQLWLQQEQFWKYLTKLFSQTETAKTSLNMKIWTKEPLLCQLRNMQKSLFDDEWSDWHWSLSTNQSCLISRVSIFSSIMQEIILLDKCPSWYVFQETFKSA